jgi:hypothetical protein
VNSTYPTDPFGKTIFDIPTKSENGFEPISNRLLKYTIQQMNSCASQISGDAMGTFLEHHKALSLQFGHRELFQHRIGQHTNGALGLILRDADLQRQVAEDNGLLRVVSTHHVVLREGVNSEFGSVYPIMV